VLLVDLGRADLDFHVDLSKGDLKKSGGSVRVGVICETCWSDGGFANASM
jgi:hypothetical protein